MKIHIHIGVHKTATTYIQGRLWSNLFKLNQAGIGYYPIWHFRRTFGRGLALIDPRNYRVEDNLKDFFQRKEDRVSPEKVRGLIISDENLIGHCGSFVKSGKLYPNGSTQLAHLRRLLHDHEVTLFCAIRSYDAFIASAYCEGIRTNQKYVSFRSFRKKIDWSFLDWPKIILEFEQAIKPTRTVVWSYETFTQQAEDVLAEIAFGKRAPAPEQDSQRSKYSTTSHTAVTAIDAVAQQCGEKVADLLVRIVAEALPKSKGFPAFEPWNETERKSLCDLYNEHRLKIPISMWLNPGIESQALMELA